MLHDSPRIRRLRNDLAALERLTGESSVIRFTGRGDPVQHYQVVFRGKSLARERGKVTVRDRHEVEIRLGASYPRTMPEIRWMTPIYHPNISEIGMVCLGGYGTHWVPSLNLDELCEMLWDMARFHNYDIRSPYNREAALWSANQSTFKFPLDARPLRDLRAALGRLTPSAPEAPATPRPAVNGGYELAELTESAPVAPATSRPARPLPATQGIGPARETSRVRESLMRIAGRTPSRPDPSSPDGVIILDMEIDLRPSPPRRDPGDGIVFIE